MKSPNYTHYMSDGAGRDSYILVNNGGLTINKVFQPVTTQGHFNTSIYKSPDKLDKTFYGGRASLAKESPSFYYPPDGTGRDWYIIHNNGGLVNKHGGSPHHNFNDNLR